MNDERHRTETWDISPDRALRILVDYDFDAQRPLHNQHVRFLAGVADRGQFDTGAPLRIGVIGDRCFLLDGRHRLTMISHRDQSYRMQVVLTEYRSMEDMRKAYSRIDPCVTVGDLAALVARLGAVAPAGAL